MSILEIEIQIEIEISFLEDGGLKGGPPAEIAEIFLFSFDFIILTPLHKFITNLSKEILE